MNGGDWLETAEKVHTLLKDGGMEVFRQQVRVAADKRLTEQDKQRRREEARNAYLIENGTWTARGQLPERPDRDFVDWGTTFCGSIKLPASIRPPLPKPRPPAAGTGNRGSPSGRRYRRIFAAAAR